MKRSSLREQIFKILFRVEFNDVNEMPQQEDMFFESGDIEATEKDRAYITNKCNKIVAKLPEIDAQLRQNLKGWTLDRVGRVELAILRLGVYEVLYDNEIPNGVAISEAVELAKKFGAEGSGAFVNGVLAKFAPSEGAATKSDAGKETVSARKKAESSARIVVAKKSGEKAPNGSR